MAKIKLSIIFESGARIGPGTRIKLYFDPERNACPTNAELGGIFTHTPRRHPMG